MGKKVKTFNRNSNLQNLDVAGVLPGKYLIQIITSDPQSFTNQFIKL
jgi:hypothetical protein